MTPPAVSSQVSREGFGKDLLYTAAALATVLGFFGSLAHLVPFLGTAPEQEPVNLNVMRLLDGQGKAAVLLISMPIFGLLNTFLVISLAKAALSLLRRCGVDLDGDACAWLLLLFVLLPVAAGTNLAFSIVLFGEVLSPLPILCMAASLVVTAYFAFRWLQKALF
ncbi:MAG TPA: hypothetical protein VKB22_02255 [Gemmatimonadales bacterium]|nr:hypothetical protein [Gemmatimonadales bacterium]